MRETKSICGFKVFTFSGTYVVFFGFHLPEEDCDSFLGFAIHRRDHTENEAYYLVGSKTFEETDPGFPAGSMYSTRDHPIQSFQWADYSAKPGHEYTYTFTALRGTPAHLDPFREVVISIATEQPSAGMHDVYFNRGVAGSQAYVRRFGDVAPHLVPNRKAYVWLSRGLSEALEDFIRSCVPGRHALRIAAYEFHYRDFLNLIKEVLDKGVDIQIVFDARKDSPAIKNRQAVINAGLAHVCHEPTTPKSYISHNKFIVKLDQGVPIAVWTGGTNFSEGGIYGHSNVADVVEDPAIPALFHDYWMALSQDPDSTPLKNTVETLTPLPQGDPPPGTMALFSPRKNLDALEWYADTARRAQEGLFMTFAFGMNDIFQDVYRTSNAGLRMALMEKKTRSMRAGPEREAEEKKIDTLRKPVKNIFAIGEFIRTNAVEGWLRERLTGLNSNVRYVHNKFMIIDPLSDDPVVVTGSANFSDASTRRNDENMIVVRGDRRVADIYLGEFMRLYSHHAFRESLQWRDPDDTPKHLRTDDWWKDYFGNTSRSVRRKFFARVEK